MLNSRNFRGKPNIAQGLDSCAAPSGPWVSLLWLSLSLVAASGGCASAPKGPYHLELKGAQDSSYEVLTDYYTHNLVRSFADSQLVREKTEMGRFQVRTEVLPALLLPSDSGEASTPPSGNVDMLPALETLIHYRLRTLTKEGPLRLNDLGFPDVGEELDYIFTPQAEVLRVGDIPPSSHFYVPPLPLPDRPVGPGDTWELNHHWFSESGLPLKLQVIAIFNTLVSCPPWGWCADLDISGDLDIPGLDRQSLRFESLIQGRMLFALEKGLLLWSEVHSHEETLTQEEHQQSLSCLVGQVQKNSCPPPQCRPKELGGLPACLVGEKK